MNRFVKWMTGAALSAILLLGGCSSVSDSISHSSSSSESDRAPAAQNAPSMPESSSLWATREGESFIDYTDDVATSHTIQDIPENIARKVILTGYVTIQTEAYDDTVAQIKAAVLVTGGFIESSNSHIYKSDQTRSYMSGSLTLRVPFESYDSVKAIVEATGQVINTSDQSRDATAEYFDTDSRVQSLRAQEASVLGMIEKAVEIEDLLMLERRLSEIRTDIELYQSRLNTIDRQSAFSTIHVDITEVAVFEPIKLAPANTWEKIQNSFIGSVNGIIAFLEGLVIFLAAAILPILLLGIPILVAWRIIRRANRKYGRKRAETPTNVPVDASTHETEGNE